MTKRTNSVRNLRQTLRFKESALAFGNANDFYETWQAPTVIVSDGPYGLGKYPGEPVSVKALAEWYAPHVAAWAKAARPDTTLWFWNSELGWANVHPILEAHGWDYQECCVWDKGIAHVAGNCNSKTIRGTPVVTEVAVRYTRKVQLAKVDGSLVGIKEWVRAEWQRSGLPMNRANEACGVANAATRKYLTQCHLWYFPPADAMAKMAAYCAKHGLPTTRPYFSLDGKSPLDAQLWERMRAKWNHSHGVTNVWTSPAVHGAERFKASSGYLHANQKPLALMDFQICASSDIGDNVWEPFGGLCSASVAALRSNRSFFAAEVNPEYFDAASQRLHQIAQNLEVRHVDAA
ncbi:DNA methylase N-4/N-6 domain-containing protein [Caballeronia arvi]|uniref:Methyltransferase n=1 Tax=Caballeronia arvi TaxID=1777135 RepID=A0A158HEZ4_9BURK|nr:DNA methyltransferase [Caballeronia arvi]SAL42541.1 DNA methylase N-4/N-6 domain-containing protein [Caballeronia arvi]